jgi:diacylglycerol kinase (ATP)
MKADFKMNRFSSTGLFSDTANLKPNHISQLVKEKYPSEVRRKSAWHISPNIFLSFQYAWTGICYTFTTQRNFRIHTAMTVIAICISGFLKVSSISMAIITLTCALVLILELLNTALESIVDLTVGQSYHELAKIAKDCAAGSVMVSAIAALLVAFFIITPPILNIVFNS